MNPFDQAWALLKEDWYDHYPTEGMSMTNRQLEGRAESMISYFIDHPNWETFKEAGHPWERVEEFFGLEGKQLNDASSAFMDESIFREKEDDRPHIDDTNIDFAPEVFMEHERHNIVNHPDGGHSHEMLPTFGNVNINTPAPIDGVSAGPDMQNIPLRDGEEDMFSPWNERYKGQRIGPHSRTPFSEQDQMKYASELFDQAWALLKWQSPLRDAWGKRRQKSRFGTAYGGFGIPRVLRGKGDLSRVHPTSLASKYLSGREKALMEHGPITHYHGTYAMDKVFGEDGGLKARVMPKHRAVETPEHLQEEPLVFTTTDWNEANEWAQQRGKQMGADPGNVGVVGVRGQDLNFAERPDEEKSQFSTADIHVGDIPQEKLVEFANPPRR